MRGIFKAKLKKLIFAFLAVVTAVQPTYISVSNAQNFGGGRTGTQETCYTPKANTPATGTLVVRMHISDKRTASNGFQYYADWGPLTEREGSFVDIQGPYDFPTGNPWFGTSIQGPPGRLILKGNNQAKVVQEKDGTIAYVFENIPRGEWRIVRWGNENWQPVVTQASDGKKIPGHSYVVGQQEPKFSVAGYDPVHATLRGKDGVYLNESAGLIHLNIFDAPGSYPKKGPIANAVVQLTGPNGQSRQAQSYTSGTAVIVPNLTPGRWRVTYKGTKQRPVTNGDSTMVKVSSHLATAATLYVHPPKRLLQTQGKSETLSAIDKSLQTTSAFNPTDYGYISDDKNLIVSQFAQSNLSCSIKQQVFAVLDKTYFFSMYEPGPKYDVIVRQIAPISAQAALLILQAEGYSFGTNSSADFMVKPPPLSYQDATLHIDRTWPAVQAVQGRIREDLYRAIRLHNLERERFQFIPFAQEYARAGTILSIFGRYSPRESGGPYYYRWKLRRISTPNGGVQLDTENSGKLWFKRNFPEYFDWFYTYWFPFYLGFDRNPNSDTWTADEEKSLEEFFSWYSIQNADSINKAGSPIDYAIIMGFTGATSSLGDIALTLGAKLISEIVTVPLAELAAVRVGSTLIGQLAIRHLQKLEREAAKEAEKDVIRSAQKLIKSGDWWKASSHLRTYLGEARAEQILSDIARQTARETARRTEQTIKRGEIIRAIKRYPAIARGVRTLSHVKTYFCGSPRLIRLNLCWSREIVAKLFEHSQTKFTQLEKDEIMAGIERALERTLSLPPIRDAVGSNARAIAQEIISKMQIKPGTLFSSNYCSRYVPNGQEDLILSRIVIDEEAIRCAGKMQIGTLEDIVSHESEHAIFSKHFFLELAQDRIPNRISSYGNYNAWEEGVVEFAKDHANAAFRRRTFFSGYPEATEMMYATYNALVRRYRNLGVPNPEDKAANDIIGAAANNDQRFDVLLDLLMGGRQFAQEQGFNSFYRHYLEKFAAARTRGDVRVIIQEIDSFHR